MCSLAPNTELPSKPTPRFDSLAHHSLFSRPNINRATSFGSDIKSEDGSASSASSLSALSGRTPSPGRSGIPGLSRPSLGPRALSYHTGSTGTPIIRRTDGSMGGTGGGTAPKMTHKRGTSETLGNGMNWSKDTAGDQPNITATNDTKKPTSPDHVDRESIGMWVKGVTSQQRLNPQLHTYLSAISAFSMPLRPDRMALIQLYCESIDRMFPLLDKPQFLKLHEIGQAPTILLHAVLLVAARHPRASRYLGHESVRQFCTNTAAKIRALLFAEVEQDRLTLVRVYALLSLHSEGPDGLENSCGDLEKAIHYAISLGIHHERPFVDKVELKKLWWSIWCMDRISACVNARPLVINNEDMGISVVQNDEHSELAQLVEACDKLESVIYLYRPRRDTEDEDDVIPPDVDVLYVGDDCLDPYNSVKALLHYTSYILAHKRVNPKDSLKEEAVVMEDSGLTPATKSQLESGSILGPESTPTSSTSVAKTGRVKGASPLAAAPNHKFSTIGNYGRRTIGTMYTPLTMVLAEEKLKSKQRGASPSVEERMSDYFSLETPGGNEYGTDDYISTLNGMSSMSKNKYSSEDSLLLSAAGSVLRIIKNAVDLPPLPMIPYCISLTMTVFLRTFPRYDTETGFGWKEACMLLEQMADRWWVAGAMGCMGWNVFNSLQENPSTDSAKNPFENNIQQADYAEFSSSLLPKNGHGEGVGPGGAATVPGAVQAAYTQDQAQERPQSRKVTEQENAYGQLNGLVQSLMPKEDLYLNMFSEFPNQTSFLDEAINLQEFDGVEEWLEEKN